MSDDTDYYRTCPIPKPEPRVVTKRRRTLTDAQEERACRRRVQARDKKTCVVPGCREYGRHLHHIVYRARSKRLRWQTSNCCLLCVEHHQLEHAGVITIRGNADEEVVVTGDVDRLKFRL